MTRSKLAELTSGIGALVLGVGPGLSSFGVGPAAGVTTLAGVLGDRHLPIARNADDVLAGFDETAGFGRQPLGLGQRPGKRARVEEATSARQLGRGEKGGVGSSAVRSARLRSNKPDWNRLGIRFKGGWACPARNL
jgi:hypothetical protein